MSEQEQAQTNTPLSPSQQAMVDLWEEHTKCEFATCSVEDTLATMVEDASVNHVPVLTGGQGKAALRAFYGTRFIPQMPPDTEIALVSRTVGVDRIVDEMIFRFTHTVKMDWMLPGIPPTGRRAEIPTVAIVQFRDGKLASEHIYWDQAGVLAQLGLLDAAALPVAGSEQAQKILDPTFPANRLIERSEQQK